MRIGIFSECYKPTTNGVVISIETFRRELEKQGWEYFIFSSGTKNYQDDDKNHVFRYPSNTWFSPRDYPLSIPLLAPAVTKNIKRLNLDIIHTQHMFILGGLGLKQGKKLHIPVIHTYHSLITDYTHYAGFLAGLAEKIVIKRSKNYCNACQAVVTPSNSMKKILTSYGVTVPINVIPTGIKIDEFTNPYTKEEIWAKWPKTKNKKIVLYLSRIAKEKNLDLLFKAIIHLQSKRQDFHLLMVGGGPELENYQKFIQEAKLAETVTFTGMITKEEGVNRIFGAADVFAFPSITETQGIVTTEAMAAGVPVVAANRMGPTDIITDNENGYLVDLNEAEFSDKINRLLDDENLRRKFIAHGRQTAQKYSSAACAQKMKELYEQTIRDYHAQSNFK